MVIEFAYYGLKSTTDDSNVITKFRINSFAEVYVNNLYSSSTSNSDEKVYVEIARIFKDKIVLIFSNSDRSTLEGYQAQVFLSYLNNEGLQIGSLLKEKEI